ncbi:cysteine peptidase family C39 domain-containing protein, partial [Parabacteroides distasonis]
FVVLYKIKKGRKFYIADPGKGLITYSREEFESHWISTTSDGEGKGIAMFFETTPEFYAMNTDSEDNVKERRSLKFLAGYVRKYRRQFALIVLGMVLGSALQLVLPFLTQSIVDVGIKNRDIGFVWLILLGQL